MPATTIDLADPGTFHGGIPYDELAALRTVSPVAWAVEQPRGSREEAPGFWLVLGYQQILEVETRYEIFSSWRGGCLFRDPRPQDLPELRRMILNMDPPEHTQIRRIVNKLFTPSMIKKMEGSIDAHARDVVRAAAEKDELDFVTDIAAEMSLRVLADVMGLPLADRHLLFDWTQRLVGDGDTDLGGDPKAFRSALMEMFQYADEQVDAKRAHPGDDVWSVVSNAEVDGERLSKDQLNRFFQLLATAGNETTRTLMTGGILTLFAHPDQMALLLSDIPSYVKGAVEEMLRYHPPVMQFRRTATTDTEFADQSIAEGDKVVMFYPAANRDPEIFDDPNRFDITRDPNPHLSFGAGPHFCLGANLARVQTRALFTELLSTLPDLEPAGAPTRVRSNMINGYSSFPVRRGS